MFFCHTWDSFWGGLEITCLSLEDSVMGAAIVPSFLEEGGKGRLPSYSNEVTLLGFGCGTVFFGPFWKRCVWSCFSTGQSKWIIFCPYKLGVSCSAMCKPARIVPSLLNFC